MSLNTGNWTIICQPPPPPSSKIKDRPSKKKKREWGVGGTFGFYQSECPLKLWDKLIQDTYGYTLPV